MFAAGKHVGSRNRLRVAVLRIAALGRQGGRRGVGTGKASGTGALECVWRGSIAVSSKR
jgi:hypothetical protein